MVHRKKVRPDAFVRNQDIKMKDLNPKVSIILPVYNGARYLAQAIDSCLNQTYRNIELIIVDDCSTDETPAIVRSFNDPRIRYVRNKTNQRLPRSLNIGFAAATGDYLTWTSDDNEFLPEAIEVMLDFLTKNKEIDFVYADNLSKFLDTGETKKRNISGPENIKERNCIGACYLYTRKVYDTIGGFNPDYELVEDYEYWVRVWQKFRMHYLPQLLYIYGEHSKSLTGTRMMGVILFDKIMKYQYRFITFAQFFDAVKQFLLVSLDCRKSYQQLLQYWLKTVGPIFRISLPLGIFFVVLGLYTLAAKTLGFALKKILWPLRKYAAEKKITRITAGLKVEKGKTNILCAVAAMTMGGSQRVPLNIAQELKGRTDLCFHAAAPSKKNERLKDDFLATFKNVITLEPVADAKLYELYYSKIIETLKIDILLISHALATYACVPALKKKFPKLKVVDILHLERVGACRDEMLWVNPYIEKRVCISNGLRKHMISKVGTDNGNAERFTTIYNGIDFSRYRNTGSLSGHFKSKFNIPEGVKLISFIARFSEEKEPLLFVDIAQKVIQSNPRIPIKFVMAGDGHLVKAVKEKIRASGMEENVLLTGVLDNIQELLADTYLLLVVASNEGIPLTVMEAMAMNIPVVSTVVGATEEVLKDGVHGYLIPRDENTASRFTEKISDILNDENLYRSLSLSPKEELFRDFSQTNMGNRYKVVLETLAAGEKT